MSTLKASLGFKGDRGYSAYDIAVQNGFVGDEQTWLATLGTSSHFTKNSTIDIAEEGQTDFDLPSEYTSNSFIDVYVDGLRLTSEEYSIEDDVVSLTNEMSEGAEVEIVVLTMSTNSLPIASTIGQSSTNTTAAGTKAVYDKIQEAIGEVQEELDDAKVNKDDIVTLTGSISNIAAGETKAVTIDYPEGFDKNNSIIINKLVSSNNVYYDANNYEPTASGFPEIDMIALTDSDIRIWMKNANTTQARTGYYKITLMKI